MPTRFPARHANASAQFRSFFPPAKEFAFPTTRSRAIFAMTAGAALSLIGAGAHAEPLLTSWATTISTKYARIYTSTTNRTNGVSATTWTGQTSPTYCGVHEIDYSTSWVYIKTTGLGAQTMGPWSNPNLAKNQAAIYRIPRTAPAIPTTKTLTPMGAMGYLVDGVAIYNTSDGYSYSVSHAEDASPVAGIGSGDGIWNRDAYVNEAVSFDYNLAHCQPSGQYHSHVDPLATRYFLGDNITYNSSTKNYAENTATTSFKHSPLLGWMPDGLPLYGPYGYDGGSTGATATANVSGGSVGSVTVTKGGTLYQSAPAVTFTGGGGSGAVATAVITGGVLTAINVTSGGSGYSSAPTVTVGGVRRMVSGYQLRDGTNGSANLNSTGTTTQRTTLPVWAGAAQNRSTTLSSGQYGPATTYTTVSGPTTITYTLGHYAEDYAYLGDSADFSGNTYVQGSRTNANGVFYDLNKYNARYCVTPEFPNGTWAYFLTIKSDGTPFYPYFVGRWYYGSPTGGTVSSISETVTTYFKGAASTTESWTTSSPNTTGGSNVTLTWNAVEGGSYQVSASDDLSSWNPLSTATPASNLAPTNNGAITTATITETGAINANARRFYKVSRTSLATYDSSGF